jgi:hypothetical protein
MLSFNCRALKVPTPRSQSYGRWRPESALIGEIHRVAPGYTRKTAFGGQRFLDELEDSPPPLIF